MTREEASARILAAESVEGVSFRLRNPEEPGLTTYAIGLGNRLIGTTTVGNLEQLERYAKLVNRYLNPRSSD